MLNNLANRIMATIMILSIVVCGAKAQDILRNDNDGAFPDRIKIDRYLDVEIWTSHFDGNYYIGDNVIISFRANHDAFVTIYSVDSRGRVNLLFPARPGDDNFVTGGVTYQLPGPDDNFDLVIAGPEGVENIQIIASRERLPVPDWYPASGLLCDWDDRHDYMDYLNSRYFIRYEGQRFAFDRTAMYVYEWEPTYFRPVHYPAYPSWTVCGNVYIDYPWGSSIYVDGIYWGCAPLYIPRVYVGWHTITVYDYSGYCWESNLHVSRYNTVVLDRTVVVTHPETVSKYKQVRFSGYKNPVSNGYPGFNEKRAKILGTSARTSTARPGKLGTTKKTVVDMSSSTRKYVRGNPKLVATDRGLETAGSNFGAYKRSRNLQSSYSGSSKTNSGRYVGRSDSKAGNYSSKRSQSDRSGKLYRESDRYRVVRGSRGVDENKSVQKKSETGSTGSDSYYRKKSGTSRKVKTDRSQIRYRKTDTGSKSKGSNPSVKSNKRSNQSGRSKTMQPSVKSSGGSKSQDKSKTSRSKSKSGGRRR